MLFQSLAFRLLGAVILMIAFFTTSAAYCQSDPCAADIDGDGLVAGADLAGLLGSWGPCSGCTADIVVDQFVDGVDLAFLLSRWGVTCAPTVSGVSPVAGHYTGGTTVTISGTRLRSPISVTFGGTPAAVVSSTANSITVITPAGTQGPTPLTLVTAGGSGSAPSPFIYGPWMASISPAIGGTLGGAPITISGQLLNGASLVTIGGTPCTSVVSVSSTTLTAVTPPGAVGAADLVVTGSEGTVTALNGFTYVTAAVPSWATLLEAAPDPAIVTSESLRTAILSMGLAWRVRDNSSGIEMLLVPPGSFEMGCIQGSNVHGCTSSEQPVHTVTPTNAFYIGRHEVTQAQWQAKMGSNPSYFLGNPQRPVERVSWNTIQGFLSATGLRLPTEAEWEYACRAGTTTPFHSGPGFPNGTTDDNLVAQIASYCAGYNCGQTTTIGGKAPNVLGLHDMLGNVWEWCGDSYAAYTSDPQTNPSGPESGSDRLVRGGGVFNGTNSLRSSVRVGAPPDGTAGILGFRVARNP
jgi:formylglycine-generating enzyme required for sulfatase activity